MGKKLENHMGRGKKIPPHRGPMILTAPDPKLMAALDQLELARRQISQMMGVRPEMIRQLHGLPPSK